MSSGRHRRTRIYGSNYDMVENCYKRQLEDLDNRLTGTAKYRRNRDLSEDLDLLGKGSGQGPKVTFAAGTAGKDLNGATDGSGLLLGRHKDLDSEFDLSIPHLLNRKLHLSAGEDDNDEADNDALLHSMALRRMRRKKPLLEDSDEDELKPLSLLRPRKPLQLRFSEDGDGFGYGCGDGDDADVDLDILKSIRKQRGSNLGRLSKEEDFSATTTSRKKEMSAKSSVLERRSTLLEDAAHDRLESSGAEESRASRRAKATRTRLDDLENEMKSLSDKQSERSKRKDNLRKILNSIE